MQFMGGSRLTKKTVSALKVSLNFAAMSLKAEFCRYELKGGEGKEYKDKGYSGKNIERPDFQRLLQDIKLGLIKRVIVYKLDRISRSIVDFAKLMELFKQYDADGPGDAQYLHCLCPA